MLMDVHRSADDHLHLAVISKGWTAAMMRSQTPGLSPAPEAAVAGRRRPEFLGQRRDGARFARTRRCRSTRPIIDPRHPAWLIRQQRLDHPAFKNPSARIPHDPA